MRTDTAFFIISFNRQDVLQRSLNSYKRFVRNEDVFIIDNGSDYKPLLSYLKELEQNGYNIIYSTPLIGGANGLNSIAPIIDEHKSGYSYYVVTDPDISLEIADKNALNVYIDLLNANHEVSVVGPMLRIIDIPKDYPSRFPCLTIHAKQFWHKAPLKTQYKSETVHFQFAPIDTTFGVFKATTTFKRLMKGVRVYQPYEALHLDWYITPSTMSKDQEHYLETSDDKIANWGKRGLKAKASTAPKHFEGKEQMICVVYKDWLGNRVRKVSLNDLNKWQHHDKLGLLKNELRLIKLKLIKLFSLFK